MSRCPAVLARPPAPMVTLSLGLQGPDGPAVAGADLGRAVAVLERVESGAQGPWRRVVTVSKGGPLRAALRCPEGCEAQTLVQDLSAPGATFDDLLGLLMAARVPCSVRGDPFWL